MASNGRSGAPAGQHMSQGSSFGPVGDWTGVLSGSNGQQGDWIVSSSSHAAANTRSPSTTSKRKRSVSAADSGDGGDGDGDNSDYAGTDGGGGANGKDDGQAKKRRRNRAPLSCSECKRRKIKCDRQMPCEACVKRGTPQACVWLNPPAAPPPKQAFALSAEHEQLKQRVTHLEAIVLHGMGMNQQQQQPYPHFPPLPLLPNIEVDTKVPIDPALSAGPSTSGTNVHPPGREPESLPDSDTEDAALVLEELALGRRLARVGSRGRKSKQQHVDGSNVSASPAGTSLGQHVDTPQSLESPSQSPHPFSSITVAPLSGWRRNILNDVWQSIPTNKTKLDWLVSQYFSRVEWHWHTLHEQTFLAEYEAFHQLLQQGKRSVIDPLWLAVLCATLALAIGSLEGPVNTPLVTVSEQELVTLPARLLDAAEACLEAADWTGRARFRTLQAIVQLSPVLIFYGNTATRDKHRAYLAASLRLAQLMSFHRLGNDPSVMPQEDYALPSGNSSYRREMALRVFHWLVAYDYVSPRHATCLPPDQITSALPGNYDDKDLLPQNGLIAPRPETENSDSTWDIVRMHHARIQMRFNLMATGEAPLDYAIILELDHAYDQLLASLPARARLDYQSASESVTEGWKRYMLHQSLHNRRLRIHRPFMSRGYREPEFRKSTDSAISSARVVLQTQAFLNRAPLVRAGFEILTLQAAIVVLYMNIWTEWPEDLAADPDYRLINEQVPFFERSSTHWLENVRKIAQQSLQLVQLLQNEISKRQAASRQRVEAGGTWKEPSDSEAETYGKMLKRIGAIVVSANEAQDTHVQPSNGGERNDQSTAASPMAKGASSSLAPPSTNAGKTPLTPSDAFLITNDAFPVEAFTLGGGMSFDFSSLGQYGANFDVGVDGNLMHSLDHF